MSHKQSTIRSLNDTLSSKESTSRFLLSVSQGHEEGMRSLESEIKMRVAQNKFNRLHRRDVISKSEEFHRRNWQHNMTASRSRKQLDVIVDRKKTAEYMKRNTITLESTKRIVHDEINTFESRLLQHSVSTEKGIDVNMFKETIGEAGTGIHSFVYLDDNYLHQEFEAIQSSLRKHHNDTVNRQIMNQKRRGKFIRELEYADSISAMNRADEDVYSQLFIPCSTEIQERDMQQRMIKMKSVFKKNSETRQKLIVSFTEEMLLRAKDNIVTNVRHELEDRVRLKLLSQEERAKSLADANKAAFDKGIAEEMQSILERVLDVTLWVISFKDLSDLRTADSDFPNFLFLNATALFASDLDSIQSMPFPLHKQLRNEYSIPRSFIDPHVLSGILFPGENILKEGNNFIANLTQSKNTKVISSKNSADFISDVAHADLVYDNTARDTDAIIEGILESLSHTQGAIVIPHKFLFSTPVNHLLGEIIVRIRHESTESSPIVPPKIPFIEGQMNVILIGSSMLARKKTAAFISKEYGLPEVSLLDVAASFLATSDATNHKDYAIIFDALSSGKPLSIEMSEALIVNEVKRLQDQNDFKGYILVDFPNNLEEMICLLRALSGIDFQQYQTHLNDNASSYALPCPHIPERFDASFSGVTSIFYLTSETSQSINDDVTSRFDLEASKVVYLNPATDAVEFLVENFTERESKHTFGIEAIRREQELEILCSLLDEVKLLIPLQVGPEGNLPDESLLKVSTTLNKFVEREETSVSDIAFINVESPSVITGEGESVSLGVESVVPQMSTGSDVNVNPHLIECSLPRRLAKALSSVWDAAEAESVKSTTSYFHSLCDIRSFYLTRRRLSNDTLHLAFTRNDGKHQLVSDFCDEYNTIEHDFRFDAECKAELCLRTLLLRDSMFRLAKQRKTEAEEALLQIFNDGVVSAITHRVYCESAALIQSEIERFNAALHLIFDFSKSVCGFSEIEKISNDLEETIKSDYDPEIGLLKALNKDARGGKESKSKDIKKGKKIEEAEPTPYRTAVPKIIVNDKLFDVNFGVTEDQDKKGKPSITKGKKAKEEVISGNTLEATDREVQDIARAWSRGIYSVNRQLYRGQSSLANSVENAVWFEAERLLYTWRKIKLIAQAEVAWFEAAEQCRNTISNQEIQEVYNKELSTADCIVLMIYEAIESCTTITWRWFIASDAVVIEQNNRIVPLPEPSIEPVIMQFPDNGLNIYEIEIYQNLLESIRVENGIIKEDFLKLMENIMAKVDGECILKSTRPCQLTTSMPLNINSSDTANNVLETINSKDRYLHVSDLIKALNRFHRLFCSTAVKS